MTPQEIAFKEKAVMIASIGLVVLVFSLAVYTYLYPPERVWEGRVWDVEYTSEQTIIYSYGKGKLRIMGIHEIEKEATYRITYRSMNKYNAAKVTEVEKIG
jgi:hypothetical protein